MAVGSEFLPCKRYNVCPELTCPGTCLYMPFFLCSHDFVGPEEVLTKELVISTLQ